MFIRELEACKAIIDVEETTANEEEAANGLANLMWYIYPEKERGKVLPTVVNWRRFNNSSMSK
ncbi:MAG TPA: hypothetical protein DEA61_03845 [Caldanaerobacter subterraneus]|uniref:Uncharacterized protein n=1 Tax=Caldanaerobacter subterraneus TaxID=911092 RepID=A0A357VL66_9THEO|nr:hypothetical protein [Caldanaerobacter subterraneus]HBT48976.1 hypothetical protein [Caldanaerobacter subterraneus]